MYRNLLVISAVVFFVVVSCNDQITEPINLEGDWISEINSRIVFSFTEDRCSYIEPTGNFASYQLNRNEIVISDTIQRRENIKVKEYKFLIDEYKDDLMTLITDSITLNSHFQYSDLSHFDAFKLRRLSPLYENMFSSLQFESTRCYGSCPSMKLNIDSLGNINYEGRAYTEKNGYYTGKLSRKKLKTLIRKIDYINLDSIKPTYSALWTDDQTCILTINSNNRTVKTNVYGFNKEPIELRILFNELMELYKSIDMKQDSLHKYYFEGFY